jgi:hypothetical protein
MRYEVQDTWNIFICINILPGNVVTSYRGPRTPNLVRF